MRLALYLTVGFATVIGFVMTLPIWVVFASVIYAMVQNH